jgi:chromosome partitioning protein
LARFHQRLRGFFEHRPSVGHLQEADFAPPSLSERTNELNVPKAGIGQKSNFPLQTAAEKRYRRFLRGLAARRSPTPKEADRLTRVIAITNQKGGVGKTTTTINLGAALAELGRKTLLIDLDPQAALSVGFGINSYELEETIYNALVVPDSTSLESVVHHEIRPNLDVAPSNIDLAAAEMELVATIGREYVLKEILESVRERYHYILIDCPPSLSLLTINALTASDSVLIPLQCEYLALRGMRTLIEVIEKVQKKLNSSLKILGILGTMYNARTIHAKEVIEEVRSVFGDKVFDVVIHSSIKFAEAPVVHQSILEYARTHPGAVAYRTLAEVIVNGEEESEYQGPRSRYSVRG